MKSGVPTAANAAIYKALNPDFPTTANAPSTNVCTIYGAAATEYTDDGATWTISDLLPAAVLGQPIAQKTAVTTPCKSNDDCSADSKVILTDTS